MNKRAAGAIILCLAIVFTAGPGWARKKGPSLRELEEAVAKNPQNPQARYMLGLKYEIAGDQQKAMKAYQEALRLKGDYPEALFRLGEVKYAQGNLEGAARDLKAALKYKPGYKEAQAALGTVYGKQGLDLINQGDLAGAERKLKLALENNSYDDASLNNLGVALSAQNRWSEAREAFRAAAQQNPNNTNAQFNLGVTSVLAGDKPAALEQYAILGASNPAMAGELFALISFPEQASWKYKSSLPSGPFPPSYPTGEFEIFPPTTPGPAGEETYGAWGREGVGKGRPRPTDPAPTPEAD